VRRSLLALVLVGAAFLQACDAESKAAFVADPGKTHSLAPFYKFDPGSASATGGILVSSQPHGATSPGTVAVVADPLGQQGLVYQETVTRDSHASDAPGSDATYLFNQPRPDIGASGNRNWVHFRIMFPAGYRPTAGEWNIFNEFHNNPGHRPFEQSGQISQEFPEVALYVTNYSGQLSHLMYRVRGGQDCRCDMSRGADRRDPRRLRRNHWYDVLLDITWSSDPNVGRFTWWLDGRRLARLRRPTLWRRPDGVDDHVALELNNYRLHASWDATVYYSQIRVGPTRGSVRLR
jgi:Polysaccharide lyase